MVLVKEYREGSSTPSDSDVPTPASSWATSPPPFTPESTPGVLPAELQRMRLQPPSSPPGYPDVSRQEHRLYHNMLSRTIPYHQPAPAAPAAQSKPDYQLQLMLLQWQNKKRLEAARAQQDSVTLGTSNDHSYLQTYQLQTILKELGEAVPEDKSTYQEASQQKINTFPAEVDVARSIQFQKKGEQLELMEARNRLHLQEMQQVQHGWQVGANTHNIPRYQQALENLQRGEDLGKGSVQSQQSPVPGDQSSLNTNTRAPLLGQAAVEQVQSVATESGFKSYAGLTSWEAIMREELAKYPGIGLRNPMVAMPPYEKEFIMLEERNEQRIADAEQRGDCTHEKNLIHLKIIRNQIKRKDPADISALEMKVFRELERKTEARELELSGKRDDVMG